LFVLGKFDLAAREYEKLHEQHMVFFHRYELVEGGYEEQEEDYEWEISFMTAFCYKLAGDFDQAGLVLERLRSSESNAEGAAWWAAKWYTERGQYDKAAELLEKELQLRFSPPDSWELSTILALAKVTESQQDAGEFAKRLARTNPELPSILYKRCCFC
jgi:tetratricopeptide (TPR) repeat protein